MQTETNKYQQNDHSVTLINPATEEEINTYNFDTAVEISKKLNTADEAFKNWKKLSLQERIDPIKRFAEKLEKNKNEIAKLMTTEMGKPISQGIQEADLCISIVNYSIDAAPSALEPEKRKLEEGQAYVTYCPQGVILSIQPWNFPFYQVIRYAIPNIIAGNTTLLKHAKNVWGCAAKIEELLTESGLPKGVYTTLYAKSSDLEGLYSDRRVRGVTFTGSAATGKKVAEIAAKNLKKTVLELGGSDAYLILEDADIDQAAKACAFGRLVNNGETCTSAKRFLVMDSVYDKFREAFKKEMKEAQLGDPMEKTTKVGPMARKDLLEKLDDQVRESLEKGATVVMGGNIEKRKGFFFQPTILENLKPGMPAYDEELFGPVASLIRVASLDEAIDIANSSRYGLAGGVFSRDEEKAMKIAREHLDTGQVNINGFVNARPNIPFGGVKDSGYGREHDHYSFHEFLNIKSIKVIKE